VIVVVPISHPACLESCLNVLFTRVLQMYWSINYARADLLQINKISFILVMNNPSSTGKTKLIQITYGNKQPVRTQGYVSKCDYVVRVGWKVADNISIKTPRAESSLVTNQKLVV